MPEKKHLIKILLGGTNVLLSSPSQWKAHDVMISEIRVIICLTIRDMYKLDHKNI